MAIYACRYVDSKGVFDIEIKAESKQEALMQLRLKGKPINVVEKPAGSKEILLFNTKKIKVKDLSLFCKQLSVMLGAGMPLNNAVGILETQATSKVLKSSLKKIDSQLKEGNMLSDAMAKQDGLYPELLLRMIESGEKTGRLDEVLERMSEHYTKEIKINNQVRGAMIYPIVLACLAFGAVIVLLYMVIPSFAGIFEQADMELPFLTRVVVGASNWLQAYWYIFLGIMIAIVVGFTRFRKTYTGKRFLDQLKLNFPVIKGPMQKIVTARFSSTLATLISAGIPLVEALDAASRTTNNEVVIEKIKIANDGIQKGKLMTTMLTETGLFPPMMLSMVKIGEESGSLETMLNKTSAYYDEELEAAIKQLLSLMEPAMIIVMGVIIGVIVASVMIPMFEINNAVYKMGTS